MIPIQEAYADPKTRHVVALQTVNQRVAAEWEQMLCNHHDMRSRSIGLTERYWEIRRAQERIRKLEMCINYDDLTEDEKNELEEELEQEESELDGLWDSTEYAEKALVDKALEYGFSESRKLAILAPWRPQ